MTDPYIKFDPGALITAEDMNEMQVDIREDILKQAKAAADAITSVDHAGDADHLGGLSKDELIAEIIKVVLAELAKKTGYRMYLKRLEVGEPLLIKHDLKSYPLVDAYQLDYFRVVSSENDAREVRWVNFYLYHSSERRIRQDKDNIDIEKAGVGRVYYKINFEELLNKLEVSIDEEATLSDLETELWKKIEEMGDFADEQHAHSPWFDKCCRSDENTVKAIKRQGAWNDLWLAIHPRKIVDLTGAIENGEGAAPPSGQIEVSQYDFNNLGVKALKGYEFSQQDIKDMTSDGFLEDNPNLARELKVMLLLKV